ncbi:serine hydrolase [Thermoactinomyces sp. CICC 10522]|uniref:serine hydrolase n=1 Tax=Thermoactinomyces sp. CICC 10522 TaxID=2767427 RepID=UPI001E39EFA0|nr:serine hydrolase [Thermoactinomyces sp. CICC 10522]
MSLFQKLTQKLDDWKTGVGGTWGIWIEDLHTEQRWSWNEAKTFYSASIIKVPIMIAVYRQADRGALELSREVILRKEDQVGGSGVLQHLTPGTRFTVKDLVTLMIIQSDNTATNLLIDLLGKNVIRETMNELGMTGSTFYNKLMILPANPEGINQITAEDMARVYKALATGKAISWHASQEMVQILKKQQLNDCFPYFLPSKNTDIVGSIPPYEMAHKTGMVTRILHDSGIFYIGSRAFILVALSEGLNYHEAQKGLGELARLVFDVYTGQG